MSQPRLIAIVGCTGTQGSSVATAFAADPQWTVRGLTRSLHSDSANRAKSALPSNIQWVEGNVNDANSLLKAFEGAYAVYGMTSGFDDELVDNREQESQQGINIAQAAEEAGAQYLVWSSLPDTRNTSHGRFTTIKHTYLKADVTAYIKRQVSGDSNSTWSIKPIFVLCGTYMQNYTTDTRKFQPYRNKQNVVTFSLPASPLVKLDLFNIDQLGYVVHSILAAPDRYVGREVPLVAERLTGNQLAETYQRVTGEEAVYDVMSDDAFLAKSGGDSRADELCTMFHYYDTFGLYGEQAGDVKGGGKVLYDTTLARKEFGLTLDSFEDFLRSSGFRAPKESGR